MRRKVLTLAILCFPLLPTTISAGDQLKFDPDVIRSAASGKWSAPATWIGAKIPQAGARVHIQDGHSVVYDLDSDKAIRFIHVAGKLTFARDRDTRLDVGLLRVQPGALCSEDGFECNAVIAPPKDSKTPTVLEVGSADQPIPAKYTARIRLVYFKGMDKQSLPAIVCCGGRMDFHGAPMNRTWVELGKTANKGDRTVTLSEAVQGWRKGDRVIVTGSKRVIRDHGVPRDDSDTVSTEERRIVAIEGNVVTLDQPLRHEHWGDGDYRSEVANLSRNVIVESADPKGVRGHTMFHSHSTGAISYAEFRHLGKEDVLGRYAIHFHLAGSTMRGSFVVGASIWDSHNRWITVHGTNHMIVRDCVGYKSVGHGYFLEDGTEVYNVFDRNLAVQAYEGNRLPKQVLAFDPNDGAGFWWANGRNTFVRNVACENNQYGFRYDSQKRSNFDSNISVLMPDGKSRVVDIRTLPFYRFADNETHTEGLYGVAAAGTDMASPDVRHPHIIKNQSIWNVHYALRPHIPKMWIENVKINGATYGIYRPELDHHVYRNLYLNRISARALGRAGRADGHGAGSPAIQHGPFTYENVTLENVRTDSPLICLNTMSPLKPQDGHFRNIVIKKNATSRRQVVDDMVPVGTRLKLQQPIAFYFHDFPGKGQTAKVVSVKFPEMMKGTKFGSREGFTGENARIAMVDEVPFPKLLDPIDDLPPATVVTFPQPGMTVKGENGVLIVRGVTTDNTHTKRVLVNGVEAKSLDYNFHLWEARLPNVRPGRVTLTAHAIDEAGNVEQMSHRLVVMVE